MCKKQKIMVRIIGCHEDQYSIWEVGITRVKLNDKYTL